MFNVEITANNVWNVTFPDEKNFLHQIALQWVKKKESCSARRRMRTKFDEKDCLERRVDA
jgi:hypothetical protein